MGDPFQATFKDMKNLAQIPFALGILSGLGKWGKALGWAGGATVENLALSASLGIVVGRILDNTYTFFSGETMGEGLVEELDAWASFSNNRSAVLSNPATPVCNQP